MEALGSTVALSGGDREALYTALGLVLVALISGAVTYLVSRRGKSGNIDTSEAATLWDEGTMMRHDLSDLVTSLRAQLASTNTQLGSTNTQLAEAIEAISGLNREIRASRSETEHAREETRLSREETRHLMEQIHEVHQEVKTANALSIGQLADNTESRRILEIPVEKRTPVEKEHLKTASDRQPESDRPKGTS